MPGPRMNQAPARNRWEWPKPPGPVPERLIRRLGNGSSRADMEIPLDHDTMNALLEVWYLGAYDFLRPAAGAVMIDAGANVGLFSVRASRWVGERGRVMGMELDAGSCRLVRQYLSGTSGQTVTDLQT